MSQHYGCDRCHKILESGESVTEVEIAGKHDLCKPCMMELEKVFEKFMENIK